MYLLAVLITSGVPATTGYYRFYTFLEVTRGYYRLLHVSTDYFRILKVTTGYYRLLQDTTGYYRLYFNHLPGCSFKGYLGHFSLFYHQPKYNCCQSPRQTLRTTQLLCYFDGIFSKGEYLGIPFVISCQRGNFPCRVGGYQTRKFHFW